MCFAGYFLNVSFKKYLRLFMSDHQSTFFVSHQYLCYKVFHTKTVTTFDGDKLVHLFDTMLACLRRTQSGRVKTGNTILMKRGIPRSWTQRLSRWTGHQTNVPSQTPKQDTNDYVADVKSLANNTVVTASEKGTKEDARTFEYVNSAGEQLFVTTNCAGIDTDDATEKRFGTIERKVDKETPGECETGTFEHICRFY